MGWNWALLLCQLVMGHALVCAGFGESHLVRDRGEGVQISDGHPGAVGYVDNYAVIATSAAAAAAGRDAISKVLCSWGYTVKEEEVTSFAPDFLGLEYDGVRRTFRIRRQRVWRLRLP